MPEDMLMYPNQILAALITEADQTPNLRTEPESRKPGPKNLLAGMPNNSHILVLGAVAPFGAQYSGNHNGTSWHWGMTCP